MVAKLKVQDANRHTYKLRPKVGIQAADRTTHLFCPKVIRSVPMVTKLIVQAADRPAH